LITGSLEILKPGLMTSIQDLGRRGLAYYAIPHSGVMDENAARIALLLLNQSDDFPLIECTSIAPELKFNSPTRIVVTGADFQWMLNGRTVSRNQLIDINSGDIVKGGFTKDGLRGYIAIDGMLKVNNVYNSYATYSSAGIGGYDGRLLKKGDRLEWVSTPSAARIIPIYKGPEFDRLSDRSKLQLCENIYKIRADSNRMGARLEGRPLDSASYQLSSSAPVLPGFIQLPPSGLPIVVLQDGQTTGGYPRIAYIRRQELSRFNQVPLGGAFRFKLEN